MGECEPRNFLRPCLLLLLQERPAHGYDLVERLHASLIDDTDAAGVYRTLRAFEREGLVRSSWCTSASGPARRTYALTAAGKETCSTRSRPSRRPTSCCTRSSTAAGVRWHGRRPS